MTCQRCGSDLPAIASSGETGGDADYQTDPGHRRNSSDTEAPGSLEAGCGVSMQKAISYQPISFLSAIPFPQSPLFSPPTHSS